MDSIRASSYVSTITGKTQISVYCEHQWEWGDESIRRKYGIYLDFTPQDALVVAADLKREAERALAKPIPSDEEENDEGPGCF